LGESDKDGFLPSTPNLEQFCCKNAAKTDSRNKEKTCFWMSDVSRSCSNHEAGGSSSTLGSVCVHKKSLGEMCSPTKTDAAHFSSEQDTNELESSTCQRARPYFRKNNFSCARTYVSWPFSNSGQTFGSAASPANSTDPSENSSKNILSERNGKSFGDMSSYSSDSKSMEFPPLLMEVEKSPGSPPSEMPTPSTPSHCSREPRHGPNTDSSISTPSPSALGLSDWDTTTLSLMSSPVTHGCLSSLSATPSSLPPSSFLLRKVESVDASSRNLMVKAVEKSLFYCEETRMTACSSSSFAPPHMSDSLQSCESTLLLPQFEQESDEECLIGKRLDPYCTSTSVKHDLLKESSSLSLDFDETEFMLPTMLSPVSLPQGQSWSSPGCSEEDEEEEEKQEEMNKNTCKHKTLLRCHMPQIANGNCENSKDYLEHGVEQLEGVWRNLKPQSPPRDPQSSGNSDEDVNDGDEDESQDETDCKDYVEQGNIKSKEVPFEEPCSSPSRDEVDDGWPCLTREEGSDPPEIAGSERDQTKAEAAGDTQRGTLDEFTAYEQDILLVDVIQDDPELFENLPQESLLKLGPNRVTETPKTKTLIQRISGPSEEFKQSLTRVNIDFHCDSADLKEPRVTNPANMAEFRRQKSNAYCRQYFSESLSCGFKMCRFQHVPMEGDEKFCIETVTRLTKNPISLQKAGNFSARLTTIDALSTVLMCYLYSVPECPVLSLSFPRVSFHLFLPPGAVFTSYYQNNPPGVYFSKPVLLALLWSLLKAGMVSDVFSVLMVSLAHKIVPGHEFLFALFNMVREKGLMGFVPELMQLTFKMASAGLVLSLDCLDCVKNTPEFQQTVNPNSLGSASGNHKVSTSAPFPEYLNLAHSIVEIELCTKQEDWRRMGEVFRSVCQSSQNSNQMERISGRIAIALLSESKDKLSLPFAVFAETENKWFLSSSSWPCEPADLESRIRVLTRLAEKTSHRDTLDVLCNLPGLKEPNGHKAVRAITSQLEAASSLRLVSLSPN
ncbi:Testis-and ovary-specific PAZ domain-containing protein 1, partial [Nibea albiflora]